MKNKIILILALFLLSGCSVEYNLEFNDDLLFESINIGKFDASEIPDFEYLTPYAIVNGVNQEFYNIDYDNQILNLSYTYGTYNYEMSETLNECYDLSSFSYDDENYYILTSDEFKCLSYMGYIADEVKINFKSNHEIINSNADYIDDNVHTWIINENNNESKPINITISRNAINNQKNKFGYLSTFFLAIGAFIVVGIVVFLVYCHGKRKNKI